MIMSDKLQSIDLTNPEYTFHYLIEKARIAREESLNAINAALKTQKTKYIWLKGQSGGLDSLLVDIIARIMCAKYNFDDKHISMNMPSQYNSADTKNSAAESSKKNIYIVTAISDIVQKINGALSHGMKNANRKDELQNINIENNDIHGQNVQARTRAALLLQAKDLLASQNPDSFVAICNTGNLSEKKNGNFTLHGDAIGDIYLIDELYKTQIHQLSSWMASEEGQKTIKEKYNFEDHDLFAVLSKTNKFKPSAELKTNQDDSQICLVGDDYSLTDLILHNMQFLPREKLCELLIETNEFTKWAGQTYKNTIERTGYKKEVALEMAFSAYDKVKYRLSLSEFKEMTFPQKTQ